MVLNDIPVVCILTHFVVLFFPFITSLFGCSSTGVGKWPVYDRVAQKWFHKVTRYWNQVEQGKVGLFVEHNLHIKYFNVEQGCNST